MPGRVLTIHVAPEEGAPVREVDEVTVDPERGLIGDRYEGTEPDSQVTLVAREDLDDAGSELGYPVPAGSTRRNIMIEGAVLWDGVGRRLALGEAILQITQNADPCGLMETWVGPGARNALQKRSGVRATVLQGGRIRRGDLVAVLE